MFRIFASLGFLHGLHVSTRPSAITDPTINPRLVIVCFAYSEHVGSWRQ